MSVLNPNPTPEYENLIASLEDTLLSEEDVSVLYRFALGDAHETLAWLTRQECRPIKNPLEKSMNLIEVKRHLDRAHAFLALADRFTDETEEAPDE